MDPAICPMCFENYSQERKPMIICQEGHSICELCVKTVEHCIFCRSSFEGFKPILNRSLLQIVEKIKIESKEQKVPFIPLSELEVEQKPFAVGGTAQIYKGKWKGKDVVIKRINVLNDEKANQQFENELKLAMKFEHPSIIKMFGKTEMDKMIAIVMEFANQGDLTNKIPNLTSEEQIDYSLQIIEGIKILHSNSIIHRDLKPENILIINNQPKIADFGISKVRENTLKVTSATVSFGYSAPELFTKENIYDTSCDIFSLSMILYEIFSKQKPFGNLNPLMITLHVVNGARPEFPNNFPKELSELINKSWSLNPKERGTLKEFHECLNWMKFPKESPEKDEKNKISNNLKDKSQSKTPDRNEKTKTHKTSSKKISMENSKLKEEEKNSMEKRAKIIIELVKSEEEYNKDLQVIIEHFMKPLKQKKFMNETDIRKIFSNIETISSVNQQILQAFKREYLGDKEAAKLNVGKIFLPFMNFLKVYNNYSMDLTESIDKVTEYYKKKVFEKFIENQKETIPECKGLGILDFLIKPVQRIDKYLLLFKELLEITSQKYPDYKDLEQVYKSLGEVASYITAQQRLAEQRTILFEIDSTLSGTPKSFSLVHPSRVFIQDAVLKKKTSKKIEERKFWLFNDLIVYANPSGRFKKKKYQYEGHLSLAGAFIRDLSSQEHSLQLIPSGSKKGYTIYFENEEQKNDWMNKIKDQITNLAELQIKSNFK
ncbi:faciogenital dysplasia protein [Anaeramoeba ignava]|uniref:Faciogenital dysplasia protein n=1 Tax=Anaeramoeba ignava TaxID=1746090 RepID=A0A9Q0LQ49_ANAIG|nr:faciogenital dysplasia protein [Anaeramoeba ignava]